MIRARLLLALLLSGLPGMVQAQDNSAESVSSAIFGQQGPVDYAYGAYQRGYYLTALELALPRAEEGDAAALTLIAELYANGLGVPQNAERAASWYQLASDRGDRLATFELGMRYQEGVGVERDRTRAAELFAKAAEAGYIPAKYNMALLHVEGVYAPPNLVRAAELMREAAEAELPEAQYDYGSMLIEGAGVLPDPEEGARYIGLAAEQGLPDAQVDFATLLYLGQGLPQNIEAAVDYYRRAAEQGNPVAQNRYAKLLAVGEGTAIDLEAAAMWRSLSRRQGLSDPALDRLLVSIPADALARAEERARFWPGLPPTAPSAATEASEPASDGPVLPNSLDPQNAPSRVVDPNADAPADAADEALAPLEAERGREAEDAAADEAETQDP